jgi:pSer/pThr/pTyr-binding forkhead associated (FHA) protein
MSRSFFLVNQTFLLPATNFALTPGKFVLGRSATCVLHVPDFSLSRRHCELNVAEASVTLNDLNSRNGTRVDGERIRSSPVTAGQRVQFGRVVFLVALENSPLQQFDLEDETRDPRHPKRRATIEEAQAILSPAEGRVLRHLLEGHSEKHVAFKLDVSPHTVHNHIREIYRAQGPLAFRVAGNVFERLTGTW